MRAAVFLDRDGVINYNHPDYVRSWEQFQFLPGVLTALERLSQSGYAIVVVSNQSAVGRGLLPQATLDEINARMQAEIERAGARLDGNYICPHSPGAGCNCRKPRPGLLLQAAQELGLDLNRSWLVGDAASDIQAALNAGCQPLLVLSGRGAVQRQHVAADVPVFPDLPAAVDWLLAQLETEA